MDETTLEPNEVLEGPATIPENEPLPPSSNGDAPALFSSDDDDDEEFEFPFVSRDSPAGTAAPADELFADGRIRPLFYPPVSFGRVATVQDHSDARPAPRVRGRLGALFLEESRERSSSSSVSSDGDDVVGLDGAPPESYCLWTPGGSSSSASSSPRRPTRKSSSTGSSTARWRRISELVVGRSRSDGKDKFVFFPVPPRPNKVKGDAKPGTANGGKAHPAEPHRIAYVANKGTPRRTFLPYREELVGFFANVNGVGISRGHHHPFLT